MPWARSQGPPDNIRVWSDKEGDYLTYDYYQSGTDHEAMKSTAKTLRELGYKAVIRKYYSTINPTLTAVFVIEPEVDAE
jgi:heme/copper-type cytochrome/quinol oxidase subunit 2